MDLSTPNTDAAGYWLGYTFDFPAYEGFQDLIAAHPAGRGLCVQVEPLTLRLDDGSHITVEGHAVRLVTEIPRVVPAEPRYQHRVVFHRIADREYDAWSGWEVTSVASLDATKVAITVRRPCAPTKTG